MGTMGTRWAAALDAVPDLVAVIDQDHRIVEANAAMRAAFPHVPVVGARCYELFHGCGAPVPHCPARTALRARAPSEARFREPHLGDRWVSVAVYPMETSTERPGAYLHVVRDVTAVQQLEAHRDLTAQVLRSLNRPLDADGLVPDAERLIREHSRLQGVTIQVSAPDAHDAASDPGVSPVSAPPCACAGVLADQVDPAMDHGTGGGSFWFAASGAHPVPVRPCCAVAGSQTLALIPLRTPDAIIGLLRLGDPAPGRLTAADVEVYEGLAAAVAVAISRQRTADALSARTLDLRKRVTELRCLFAAARLAAETDRPADAVLQELAACVPTGWRFPELACARLTVGDRCYVSADFRESPWRLTAPLPVPAEARGAIEVFYREAPPLAGVDPFCPEEHELLAGLANQVARFVARRDALAALRAERDKLETVVAQLAAGVAIYDAGGRCVLANASAARHFGTSHVAFERQVAPGTAWWRESGLQTAAERAIAGGTRQSLEVKRTARFDVTIWLECHLAPVVLHGTPHLLLATYDVLEQRQLAEQLRQGQRLEALGRLAGGVAHDFNNILGAILGYSELCLEQLDEAAPMHADLAQIRGAADRARTLTRQLLAFSRKQTLQPRVLDLNAHVTDLVPMLERVIGEDIVLTTRLAPQPGRVRADPGQLDQILMNLVVNARDAMPGGGTLTIETQRVELDAAYVATHLEAVPGPHVALSVTDTGCGMDAEIRARVFDPFFTTKPQGQGTGLGLSTVHGIVKQNGGAIWIYSELGQGTVVKVYLPVVTAAADAATPPATAPAATTGTETVLVVEDEASIRLLLARILGAAGYRVLTAANGAEALTCCDAHAGPIHLVLTDVVMPRLSGAPFVERLAAARPDARVIYMSGYTDDTTTRGGALDPTVPFIEKPFSLSGVLAVVRRTLDAPAPRSRGPGRGGG